LNTSNNPNGAGAAPITFNKVLWEETQRLRPKLLDGLHPDTYAYHEDPKRVAARAQNLRDLYAKLGGLRDGIPASRVGTTAPVESHGVAMSALCLSGGGIRSATFNLGVIQALARAGVLGSFDYLSSVSGGGYVASWLRTWMHREGTDRVINELRTSDLKGDPLQPEPEPLDALREYSNYLTPKLGLFSADTWTAVAIVLRNLILNWLVIIPLLGTVIAIPQVLFLAVKSSGFPHKWGCSLLIVSLLIEFVASVLLYWFRRFNKKPGTREGLFVTFAVFPMVIAAAVLSSAVLGLNLPWMQQDPSPSPLDICRLWVFATVWCIVVPILGWSASEISAEILLRRARREAARSNAGHLAVKRSYLKVDTREIRHAARFREFSGLFVSGAVAASILVGIVRSWMPYLYNRAFYYVVLALPLLLGIYLLARVLFVAIASRGESPRRRQTAKQTETQADRQAQADKQGRHSSKADQGSQSRITDFGPSNDSDREWWARLSAWVLVIAVSWAVVTGLCLIGGCLLDHGALKGTGASHWVRRNLPKIVSALGGISGIVAALAGKNGDPAGSKDGVPAASGPRQWVFAAAAPLFSVCVIILIGWGTIVLGEVLSGLQGLAAGGFEPIDSTLRLPVTTYLSFLLVPVGLLATGAVVGFFVNVNRFSLHGMYRNRLVRAYLGASNRNRDPDPFTGFALSDNPRLSEVLAEPVVGASGGPPAGGAAGPAGGPSVDGAEGHAAAAEPRATRLLPVINASLNLVCSAEKLAWQQRKAESFSMTPLFCGNFREGYRKSCEYGGPRGISVGTAVTISGAAANPNMGSSSSPSVGFLLALFNVRLGAWLGNTNRHGECTFQKSGPPHSAWPLVCELFGLTSAERKYVNLSDGGHFDNLGMYEMVLRRCRNILVCDAGRDNSYGFQDLGNAIRKVRIDFGIPIEFESCIEILPGRGESDGAYCATAVIRYSEIDGDDAPDGQIVYIKPTLRGAGPPVPYDVYSYGKSQVDFPHETTTDQWFSESQFESYRMLGFHSLRQIVGAAWPARAPTEQKDAAKEKAAKTHKEMDVGSFITSVTEYLKSYKGSKEYVGTPK
jgi:hypothetical protein